MHFHPEQREGELYIGTESKFYIEQSAWKTRRMGEPIATGRRRPLYPWFVQASEVEAAIVALENDPNPKPWASTAIGIYRKMLEERS